MTVLASMFGIAGIAVLAIRRSALGRRLVATNDSPAASATIGLGVRTTKLLAFAMSAGLAGLAGALYGGLQGQVGANDFGLFSSMTLLLLLVICGVRTVSGALVAGIGFAALPVLQSHVSWVSDLVGLVTGVGVVLVGRLPNGLFGSSPVHRRIEARRLARVYTSDPITADVIQDHANA
jgi:branched-chain amino acid transport system permease protein